MVIKGVTLIAKPGMEKALEEDLLQMIPQSETEDNTLVYCMHRYVGEPGKFFFYERYTDEAAFDYHNNTPTCLGLKVAELCAEDPVPFFLEVVGEINWKK